MQTIRIESINGGQEPVQGYGARDSFLSSVGIDPAQGNIGFNNNPTASGALVPVASTLISGSSLGSTATWIIPPPPKPGITTAFVYAINGSVYTTVPRTSTFTALSDGGSMTTGGGNGAAYYDNYVYFAKNTTVARYGPMDGTPAFNGDYWVTTLGKTALTNTTTYPTDDTLGISYPNHVMHRHSDGKLYFADVTGNQGIIHYISTSKTTVEGDTDNGSTYGTLTFGSGLYPTAIESYGSNLVIALFEGDGTINVRSQRAKIAFWDTTSQNFNSITWVEFPDSFISALCNVNGTLYAVSGMPNAPGFRLSQYVGGSSFREVFYTALGQPAFPGAVEGTADRIMMGSKISLPSSNSPGCVYSYGLQQGDFAGKMYTPVRATQTLNTVITALALTENRDMGDDYPIVAWSRSAGNNNGLDRPASQSGTNPGSEWYSKIYRVGQPFVIKRIRVPLYLPGDTITLTIYFDGAANQSVDTYAYTINSTKFTDPLAKSYIVANILIDGSGTQPVRGENMFFIGLAWAAGSTNDTVVDFPILVDYEIIPDTTAS